MNFLGWRRSCITSLLNSTERADSNWTKWFNLTGSLVCFTAKIQMRRIGSTNWSVSHITRAKTGVHGIRVTRVMVRIGLLYIYFFTVLNNFLNYRSYTLLHTLWKYWQSGSAVIVRSTLVQSSFAVTGSVPKRTWFGHLPREAIQRRLHDVPSRAINYETKTISLAQRLPSCQVLQVAGWHWPNQWIGDDVNIKYMNSVRFVSLTFPLK